ncbi:MAG TPA: hypothetical protein PKI19_11505 [Elusimicrobiales bacterium]|nr:hypothetical protein [Elusimicrobiales bacterium]
MKYLMAAALALACGGAPALAAYDEEGLSEAVISTEAARNGDEEDDAPFVQESDEDLADFVQDYIRRDTALKGAFLIEDAADRKILKLHLVSLDRKAQPAAETAKTVTAVMRDAAGKTFSVVFYVQVGPWDGLDIFKLELKRTGAAKKQAPEKKPE